VGEPATLNQLLQSARIEWHGVQLGRPDWSDHSHSLAYTLGAPHWRFVLHAMFNACGEPLTFELPSGEPYRWQRCVDTALPSPDDYRPLDEAPLVTEGTYCVASRSCVVLVSPLPQGVVRGNRRDRAHRALEFGSRA
jgi:isoamylase